MIKFRLRSMLTAGCALGAILGAALLPATAGAQAPAAAQALPNEIVVRYAGANTVGVGMLQPLGQAWARKLGFRSVRVEQTADPLEFHLVAEGAEGARKLRMEVKFHGTPSGTEPVVRGQVDFWGTVRPVRESDLDALRRRNVPNVPSLAQMQAPGVENVIALDAIAFITHPSNPVRRISVTQLKDVLLGKIVNWSQVGGPDMPIQIYAPDPGFGTFEGACQVIMGIATSQQCVQQMAKLAAPHFKSVDDLSDTVAGNPAALGWVGIVAKRSARPLQLITECGGTADPEIFNAKAEEYLLTRRYFLYTTPGKPLSPSAKAFLDFVLSEDGQNALKAAGAVDLLPGIAPETYVAERLDGAGNAQDGGRTRIRPTDARAFEEATQNASRLSITFRFREGTDNLDSRAEADLVRLAELMKKPAYAKSQLVLIGFSAARGDYAANRALSRERAMAVRERLVGQLGVKDVVAVGVGPTSPVACNSDGAPTAHMNQRVEVWVRRSPGI